MAFHNNDLTHFKESIKKEKIIYLNFNYLLPIIEEWWLTDGKFIPLAIAKFRLISLLLKHCTKSDLNYFNILGKDGISAVCIDQIFDKDCHQLSFITHEALSELFSLKDITYPYEEHKKLYLKPNGENYKDWGNGYGEITPHSDDLYEDLDADFLSLTVCRDKTNTPTLFYFPRDILHNFTDEELTKLLNLKAKFISGKNVKILKTRQRAIIEFSEQYGYKFYLDFRIDNEVGERMLPLNCEDKPLIDKMRANLTTCLHHKSPTKTGTFLIVANHKILHARSQMQINKSLAIHLAKKSHFTSAPRLLYRSKGQDAKLSLNLLGDSLL